MNENNLQIHYIWWIIIGVVTAVIIFFVVKFLKKNGMGLFKSKDNNKDNNNAMECKKYYNVKTKKFSFKGLDVGFLSGVVQGVKLASFEKENIELGDKLLLFDQMQYAICQSISAITDEKLKDRLLMYHIFLIGEMNKMATVEGYQGEVPESKSLDDIAGQDSSDKIEELKKLIAEVEPDPNKRVKEEEIIKIINNNLKNSVNVNGNNNTIFDGVNDSNITIIQNIFIYNPSPNEKEPGGDDGSTAPKVDGGGGGENITEYLKSTFPQTISIQILDGFARKTVASNDKVVEGGFTLNTYNNQRTYIDRIIYICNYYEKLDDLKNDIKKHNAN